MESALLRLAEVQDCAVVAAPPLWRVVCAFIIAQQVPTDYQQLRQQLTRMGLSAWKIPDQIEFLDHWPLTAVGKIDKRLTARRRPLSPFCPISANRPETVESKPVSGSTTLEIVIIFNSPLSVFWRFAVLQGLTTMKMTRFYPLVLGIIAPRHC